jgi:hypothetical protein
MSNGFRLITGSRPLTTVYMQQLLVRLAVRGPVRWLMCGKYVDLQSIFYGVVQQAKEDYQAVLKKNIIVARAETCYGVVALLRKTEAAQTPTIITDMLLSFYDDGVREDEAIELLNEGLGALKQLSRGGPVIVSASSHNERAQLFASLSQEAKDTSTIREISDMGHTTLPMTQRFRNEGAYFGGFRKALLSRRDQLLFDELWGKIETYIPAAEKSTHPLLIATILMSMILEERKRSESLQTQVERIQREIEQEAASKDQEIKKLRKDIRQLEEDFTRELEDMEKRVLEEMHPEYAS